MCTVFQLLTCTDTVAGLNLYMVMAIVTVQLGSVFMELFGIMRVFATSVWWHKTFGTLNSPFGS